MIKSLNTLITRLFTPLTICVGLGVILAFYGITFQSFGLDESFSMYISKNTMTMANAIWHTEANMWLYYLLLHFWIQMGSSEFVVRSFSALCAIFTIPVQFLLAKRLFSKRVAIISTLLMVTNIFFVLYAQNARSYALTLLLTTLSMYCLTRFDEAKKFKFGYTIFGILAIYAHFYAGLVILAQGIWILCEPKRTEKIVSLGLIFMALIPLFLAPSFHSHQVDWLTSPNISSLIGTFFVLAGDNPISVICEAIIIIAGASYVLSQLRKQNIRLLTLWLVLPIVLSFAISLTYKSIYQSVYFILCLPAYEMLIAVMIDRISNKRLGGFVITGLVLISVWRLGMWYREDTQWKWVISNQNDDWRTAEHYIDAHSTQSDVVIFYGYYGRIPFQMYQTSQTPPSVEISSDSYNLGGGSALPEPNMERITRLDAPTVWLVLNRSTGTLFNREKQSEEVETALSTHYRTRMTHDFHGVLVMEYTHV